MTDEDNKPVVRIVEELPPACNSCGGPQDNLFPVSQQMKTTFGLTDVVVGYFCDTCGNSHLYAN